MGERNRSINQFPIKFEPDIGTWAQESSGLGVSKAHVLRTALREGRRILEQAADIGELLVEETYSRHNPGYTDRATLQLSDEDLAWVTGVHESTGVIKSTVIRVAMRLGRVVVDRKRRAAADVGTDLAA